MSTTGITRRRSIRESFSKLCRQFSNRRNSRETVITGLEAETISGLEVWEDSTTPSTSFDSVSWNSSQTDLDDAGLENFLMPARTLDSVIEDVVSPISSPKLTSNVQTFIDLSQPFRFLDLPIELKNVVYKHYFPQPEATVRIKGTTADPKFTTSNPWRESQALLLTCQEIYWTAKEFSKVQTFTLDLSQYTVKRGDMLPISNIVSQLGEVGSKCSRLILSQKQSWNILEPRLFPILRKVDIWDYTSGSVPMQAMVEARIVSNHTEESRDALRHVATAVLANHKTKLPAGVAAQFSMVLDLLVCVGPDESRARHDKLRHIFSVSDELPEGSFTVDWAHKLPDMAPLPLTCLIAPHKHHYCEYLQEREPELIARGSC